MLLFLPFYTLPYVFGEKIGGKVSFFFLEGWSRIFGWLTGIQFRAKRSPKVRSDAAYIYCCNHSSFVDTPAFLIAIPGDFRPLGKVEMKKIPIFGWIYHFAVIIVDRSSVESRRESIRQMMLKLKDGISVLIFPEGSMNRSPYPLTSFYDGAFRIAIETQTPIVPMVIINSRFVMPRTGQFTIRPGRVTMVVGDPIPVQGLVEKDRARLKEKVYAKMREMILANQDLGQVRFIDDLALETGKGNTAA